MYPRGREIVLGVAGGISAYKSCDLLRRLQESGFLVTVIPTRASLNFVGISTWEALSGREVPVDLWNNVQEVAHIKLAKRADAIIIAPTTADLIGKFAAGLADDLLTNIVLASSAPKILVPAMHSEMWQNAAVQANVGTLKARGFTVVEPDSGRMTGSDVGIGRYPETTKILDCVNEVLDSSADLLGKTVLISAGGTREPIDPIRFIGNNASGKQGYALAYAAAVRGAQTILVAANLQEADIEGVRVIHVSSALQMQDALTEFFGQADIVLFAAAVADVRPRATSQTKIGKEELANIELIRNPDIAAELSQKKSNQILVGFAAQASQDSREDIAVAREKLRSKNLDFIYLNDVTDGAIFGSDTTEGVILGSSGELSIFPSNTKVTLAHKLLDLALDKLG
jgi:phosphopantothenoylcysteine decarboxylase/phosphopantothenate--cysteine ligase